MKKKIRKTLKFKDDYIFIDSIQAITRETEYQDYLVIHTAKKSFKWLISDILDISLLNDYRRTEKLNSVDNEAFGDWILDKAVGSSEKDWIAAYSIIVDNLLYLLNSFEFVDFNDEDDEIDNGVIEISENEPLISLGDLLRYGESNSN